MRSVLVGIDSGGTRTNVEITVDDQRDPIEAYERSDSLSGVLTPEQYPKVIRDILSPLRAVYRKHRIPQSAVTYVFISSAAYTQAVREEVVAAVLEIAPDQVAGRLDMVGVCNDCVALVYGCDVDGMIIAGTGSDILFRAREEPRRLYQVGGDEWVAADQGSAFWIALRALRLAYNDLRADNDSVLVQRLREHFGVRRDSSSYRDVLYARLRDLSFAGPDMKKDIARFARPVCNAAERGDEAARQIVLEEARELADLTMECIRRTYQPLPPDLNVVQCGGVFRSDFYRTTYEQQFEGYLRYNEEYTTKINWVRVPTATGAAVNLARTMRDNPRTLLSIDRKYRPVLIPIPAPHRADDAYRSR